MLEGALLESRAGNTAAGRAVLGALMRALPRHGPVYAEAARLEERLEEWERMGAVRTPAPPPPPSLRTNRTRRVLHPVLIGHAASFTPYYHTAALPLPLQLP